MVRSLGLLLLWVCHVPGLLYFIASTHAYADMMSEYFIASASEYFDAWTWGFGMVLRVSADS